MFYKKTRKEDVDVPFMPYTQGMQFATQSVEFCKRLLAILGKHIFIDALFSLTRIDKF